MKHLKLHEGLNNSKRLSKCKFLFREIFCDNIEVSRIKIEDNRIRERKHILSFSVNSSINEKNYSHFISLFNFIKELNETFNFNRGRMNIYIDNLDEFINGLEMLKTSNKYNL